MKVLYLFFFLILTASSLQAQSVYSLLNDASSIIVTGTSSVHDWDIRFEELEGEATFLLDEDSLEGISSLIFSTYAKSVDSGKRIMNGKTRDALDSKKHPKVTFTLTEVTEIMSDSLTLKGDLIIAGFTKEIVLTGVYSVGTDGSFTASGKQQINMSDYGIKPPTAMLGTLKTGEEVVVEFNVSFQKN